MHGVRLTSPAKGTPPARVSSATFALRSADNFRRLDTETVLPCRELERNSLSDVPRPLPLLATVAACNPEGLKTKCFLYLSHI